MMVSSEQCVNFSEIFYEKPQIPGTCQNTHKFV